MATAPLRPCTTPRCPALTTGGPCAQHKKQRQQVADTHRGTAQERGYDYQWATFSTAWRAKYPVCGMRADGALHAEHSQCVQQGKLTTTDLVVDHIRPMADGGEKYAPANLSTLCRACNTRKNIRLEGGFGYRR